MNLYFKILYTFFFFTFGLMASLSNKFEQEPNDLATNATVFRGSKILVGILDKRESDHFLWKVSKKDTQFSWNFELSALPQQTIEVEVSKVIFQKAGFSTGSSSKKVKELKSKKMLFVFKNETGKKNLTLSKILPKKGQYLIRIYAKNNNKASPYTLKIIKKREASSAVGENKEYARKLYIGYCYKNEKNEAWFKLDIEEKEKLWEIQSSTTLENNVTFTLENEAGAVLVSKQANNVGKASVKELELDVGSYYLRFRHPKNIHFCIDYASTGTQHIDTQEKENNNNFLNANNIQITKVIHGDVTREKDTSDYFTFVVPQKLHQKTVDIHLQTLSKTLEFSLYSKNKILLQTKKVDSNYTMKSLSLDVGQRYYISVNTTYYTEKRPSYSLHFSEEKDKHSQVEIEPNDYDRYAPKVDHKKSIEGNFTGEEYDCFRFSITQSNHFWTFDVKSKNALNLYLYQNHKEIISSRDLKDESLVLSNLFLSVGDYTLCAYGKGGKYNIDIQHKNKTDMNLSVNRDFEHEPNQSESQANALPFGIKIQGTLERESNADYFNFTLKNDTHIKLRAIAPKDKTINMRLDTPKFRQDDAYPKKSNNTLMDGIYPIGRYVVTLRSDTPSYEYYSLLVEKENPFNTTDIEPNNGYTQAVPIKNTLHINGHTSSTDTDWYALSIDTNETNLTINGNNLKDHILIYPKKDAYALELFWDNNKHNYTTILKNTTKAYLVVNSNVGYYDYNISFSHYNKPKVVPFKVGINIVMKDKKVATYYGKGQVLHFNLNLKAETDSNQTLYIQSHSSDKSWKILSQKRITHSTDKREQSIPVIIKVPKNVTTEKVIITIKVSNDRGTYKTRTLTLKPKENVVPKETFIDWGIPDEFVGGLNVAQLSLGAKRIIEHNETELGYVPNIGHGYHKLFDDITYTGRGFGLDYGRTVKDENVTIALAGDERQEIIGFILNTKGYGYGYALKDFSIYLSSDGITYKKVYKDSLKNSLKEQFFKLKTPLYAKYAKLSLHNNQEGKELAEITLGEWKVIAKQNIEIKKPINIANPNLGGHVVKSSVFLSENWDEAILTSKVDIESSKTKKDEIERSFVLGFKHERAAKITSLSWLESPKSDKQTRYGDVDIAISTQTPNGPWKEVGIWKRNNTLEKNITTYTLAHPTWARYVKFTSKMQEKKSYFPPETLAIYEENPSEDYLSILGEWGISNHHSYYELQTQGNKTVPSIITGNETKKYAFRLENNQSVGGTVSITKHQEDWYKIIIPKGENKLTLILTGDESVDVDALLYDENNTLIESSYTTTDAHKHTVVFNVNKGSYYIQVHQPLINIVFAWDNSGSIAPYADQIKTAIHTYISNIEEGVDNVNLFCFEEPGSFILSDFSSNQQHIQTAFSNFDWRCTSSNSIYALALSTQALKDKKGIKGMIIIADDTLGDYDGTRDSHWNLLKKVHPKIFAIHVTSSYETRIVGNLIHSWSRVNNGTYVKVQSGIDMIKAINHATHILKRPVFYTLRVESEYERPLGKGTLRVIDPKQNKQTVQSKKTDKNFAVELILDASGSMLKRIKGKRRIEIAKDVLIKAVQESIPPKTQVALRVFGHKKADSCRTDLEMRLQPLNVRKTSNIIRRIKAKNLAKTPIATSLAKVANDLKYVKGKRVIILVTDGKETCEGNVTQEIEKLKALDINVLLNIVGFAINDKYLKKEFETWAKLGNGTYFEANDKKSLNMAVKKALQVPYRVYDKENILIKKGMVGDAGLKLKGGKYKVIIESYPQRIYDEIVIKGEAETVLNLKNKMEK